MSDMTNDVKSIKVEEYSLVDFVMKIQQGIRDGYEVTDQSDEAPLQIGGGFYTIMREKVKPVSDIGKLSVSVKVDTSEVQEYIQALSEGEVLVSSGDDVHGNLMGTIPITNAYVETVEPPKEPTLDESLPKDEQAAQTKQPTKRGRK